MSGIDRIRDNGWFQGATLRVDSSECGSRSELAEGYYIVVSQDCDIVAESYDLEPYVEIIPIESRDSVDGNCALGKNPRVVDISLDGKVARLHQRRKNAVPRNILEHCVPVEPCLNLKDINILRSWLASRYLRSAFPDEFVECVRPGFGRIKKALRRYGVYISGVYVMLGPVPGVSGDIETEVVLTVLPESLEDQRDAFDVSTQAKESLRDIFESLDGITLDSCELLSEDEFTLSELRRSLRLDRFDYLSSGGGRHAAPSPQAP